MNTEPRSCLLLVTGAYHTDGGIAAVNRLTIKAVAEKGYSLNILSLVEEDNRPDLRYLPDNADVCYQVFGGNKVKFALAVWQAVLSHQYAYIFVDHVNLASILAPLSWLNRTRYIIWLFGIEVFPPRPDWEGKLGLGNAWKRLAISEFTRRSVLDRFPDLPIELCELALDPVRHAGAITSGNSDPIVLQAFDGSQSELGKQVILHVGRMVSGERYKGQDSLIQAFPLIYEKHPQAQLVLAGQGDDMPRIKRLAQALPTAVQTNIFFPGYVPDELLMRIYQTCYVFAMPSVGEGFGLVYLEAMNHGKPCLGGKVDATPFVVRDGQTGLLVDDPRSPEQVANALNWFLSHPQETQAMGQRGADLVQSHYLFPHFQQRFWNVVEKYE